MPHIRTPEEKAAAVDIQMTSSLAAIPDGEYEKLAHQLSAIHGTVRIAREASGVHFYMASPYCLENFGEEELYKLHLAVNVEKFLTTGEGAVGMCMKSGQVYNIKDLLFMPPVSERGYDYTPLVVLKKEADQQYLEPDGQGNMVPKSPGKVVPITRDMPADHPVIMYLNSRNFDIDMLREQFDIAYCEEERTDIYYRRLINGFRATSQCRLIFYIKQHGIVRGWQARILEIEQDGLIYFFHPYKRRWTAVLQVVPGGKPVPLPEWEGWDSAKYVIAHGTVKQEILMGYDATIAWHKAHPEFPKFVVLAEGALDAGRVGAPAMAMLGKHLSADQAQLLLQGGFKPIIFVKDLDESGEKAAASVHRQLDKLGIADRLRIITAPTGCKDLGEISTHTEAWDYVQANL